MITSSEFLRAVLADPRDVEARLVYADWLQAQGDPRGELIAVQHALERTRGDGDVDAADDTADAAAADADNDGERAALRDTEARLLATHADALLGPLAAEVARAADPGRGAGLTLDWWLGFIDAARVGRPEQADMEAAGALLAALLTHPSARVLRSLTLGIPIWGRSVDFDLLARVIADAGPLPALRRLQFGDFVHHGALADGTHHVDWDISAVALGDLSVLWPACPNLEHLVLQGNHLDLGEIELPRLRHFQVCSSGFDNLNLVSVTCARWPMLQTLILWLGDGEYGGRNNLYAIENAIGTVPPRVTHLGLMNTEHADAICELLSAAPVAAQLEVLDLSLGTLSDVGARALNPAAFPRLRTLIAIESYLSEDGIAALSWCPEVIAHGQREPEDWNGEPARYVSVSE